MRTVLRWAAIVVPLVAGGALSPAAAQPVSPAPLVGGNVTFVFHATFVGRLEGRAPIARAEFTGDRLESVRGQALVNVAEIQTGNGARDGHLREAMEADTYPVIRFDLVGVEPGATTADTSPVTLEGTLTLHGVTRSVSARGTVVRSPGGTQVTADFPVDMRDYGIKPPVRALLLRVAPDVVVTARLSFAPPRSR
jgi:polyisoprenoid-binding protein YceI